MQKKCCFSVLLGKGKGTHKNVTNITRWLTSACRAASAASTASAAAAAAAAAAPADSPDISFSGPHFKYDWLALEIICQELCSIMKVPEQLHAVTHRHHQPSGLTQLDADAEAATPHRSIGGSRLRRIRLIAGAHPPLFYLCVAVLALVLPPSVSACVASDRPQASYSFSSCYFGAASNCDFNVNPSFMLGKLNSAQAWSSQVRAIFSISALRLSLAPCICARQQHILTAFLRLSIPIRGL